MVLVVGTLGLVFVVLGAELVLLVVLVLDLAYLFLRWVVKGISG